MKNMVDFCVPNDYNHQVNSWDILGNILGSEQGIYQVMDLGCGDGSSVNYFRTKAPYVTWFGLDLKNSSGLKAWLERDASFCIFDGINIPFRNDGIDMVYCHQVFEHVRYPTELLREVLRILRPGGFFIGSTSHLEPYHAYSVWNYTPYGFWLLLQDEGFQVLEMRPSIDALTLIIRRVFRCHPFFSRWWTEESPLNQCINVVGRIMRMQPADINLLNYCFVGNSVMWHVNQ